MDMDNYIKRRRMKNKDESTIKEKITNITNDMNEWRVFSMFKRGKQEKEPHIEEYEDEDEDYMDDEAEIEAIDEMEDELEERRESALKRFFKKLRLRGKKPRRYEDEDDEEYLESEEDEYDIDEIKEVIKITHKWLERLPDDEIARFKRSEDFEKYKAILKKLEMIK